MSTEISYRGQFTVWSFTIEHGRLLLRRTKSTQFPTRVDILLKDVGWISIPMHFTDIRICEVPRKDVHTMLVAAGSPSERGRNVYSLSGAGWQGHVLAGVVTFHEDDGEYDDQSALLE